MRRAGRRSSAMCGCGAAPRGAAGGGRSHRECWLKRQAPLDPLRPDTARRGPGRRTPHPAGAHDVIVADHGGAGWKRPIAAVAPGMHAGEPSCTHRHRVFNHSTIARRGLCSSSDMMFAEYSGTCVAQDSLLAPFMQSRIRIKSFPTGKKASTLWFPELQSCGGSQRSL